MCVLIWPWPWRWGALLLDRCVNSRENLVIWNILRCSVCSLMMYDVWFLALEVLRVGSLRCRARPSGGITTQSHVRFGSDSELCGELRDYFWTFGIKELLVRTQITYYYYYYLLQENMSVDHVVALTQVHFNRFAVSTDWLLITLEEGITLIHRITKKGKVIKSLDIKLNRSNINLVRWADGIRSQHSSLNCKTSCCHETVHLLWGRQNFITDSAQALINWWFYTCSVYISVKELWPLSLMEA